MKKFLCTLCCLVEIAVCVSTVAIRGFLSAPVFSEPLAPPAENFAVEDAAFESRVPLYLAGNRVIELADDDILADSAASSGTSDTVDELTASGDDADGADASDADTDGADSDYADALAANAAVYAYAYQQLSAAEQQMYLEILQSLLTFSEDTILSATDIDELSFVFQCLMNDHPEIFYVDGYSYTLYTKDGVPVQIVFNGHYTMGEDEAHARQLVIDAAVNDCLNGLPAGADEYNNVRYVYEYLINHTEYDVTADDNQNICSVFIQGKSVCQGYAKATQYLLNKLGIPATLVLGRVSSGENHAWNLVQIDGDWYHVDTTWGDASYQAVGSETFPRQQVLGVNYDYLCVTTEQIKITHVIDNPVALPNCTAMAANYYVREGLYFTEVGEEQLSQSFAKAYAEGRESITVKCADANVYSQMEEYLIGEQAVFSYLQNTGGVVSYVDDAVQCSLTFWL